jgi:HD superfamily phosphohydrolase
MAADDRVKFDVACALAVMSPAKKLTFTFPETLKVDGQISKILDDCVDQKSFERSFCRIRADFSEEAIYFLEMGNDQLTLFRGGEIRVGGSGVTRQLFDRRLKRHYALKVPRVSVLAYIAPEFTKLDMAHLSDRIEAEYRAFENEREISRLLSHENIARHFFGDSKEIPDLGRGLRPQFPFSISEWIDGARRLHEFLQAEKPTVRKIISLVGDTFSALGHIHSQKVIHWDLKCDNILVSSSGVVKVIDFGNAKVVGLQRDEDLTATTTDGKYPQVPVFKALRTEQDESRRFRISLQHSSWNHVFIDLWMLAQEWNRCLVFSESFLQGKSDLTDEERQVTVAAVRAQTSPRATEAYDCLRIIFDRILFPFSHEYVQSFLGPGNCFVDRELYFRNAAEIREEISRIQPSFGAAQDVPELLVSLDEIVRLPVTGNSVFTERVSALVDTKVIQPTTLHNQLAQVGKVFPGATHTRFEHLLGTLTTAAYYVRSLYLNDMNAFWRVSAGANDVRAVLLASVLHDAGHLAFGHFIEEMDDLMHGLKHTDYTLHLLKRCLADVLRQSGEKADETQPNGVGLFAVSSDEISELIDVLRSWGDDTAVRKESPKEQQVAELIRRTVSIFEATPVAVKMPAYLSRKGTSEALNNVLKSIIDGPIDADKLDYLRRDSLHCGVFFSNGIDLERFFESIRVCVSTTGDDKGGSAAIGVSEKGVAPVETLITARYHLYSIVYWHRTVRCITAMLQRLIAEVRLSLDDHEWRKFITSLVEKFRQLDDKQALEWLGVELRARNLWDKSLLRDEAQGRAQLHDLLEALLGERRKYFRVAFELSYVGPVDPSSTSGRSSREELHEDICGTVHPQDERVSLSDPAALAFGKRNRERLDRFRRDLEKLFQERVNEYLREQLHLQTEFRLETTLLDVPEPGKDQIRGVLVDRRNKRSRHSSAFQASPAVSTSSEFVDLASVSPIAATLADVFKRWARKVRIFMTRDDLKQLQDLGLELGDVASFWEQVLYTQFHIDPAQPSIRYL